MAMHSSAVGNPPEIKPIRINLVVRDQHQAVGEHRLQVPILCLMKFTANAFISADSNSRWSTPLGDGNDEDPKGFLCQCHICIIVVLPDEIQRAPDQLDYKDTEDAGPKPDR